MATEKELCYCDLEIKNAKQWEIFMKQKIPLVLLLIVCKAPYTTLHCRGCGCQDSKQKTTKNKQKNK